LTEHPTSSRSAAEERLDKLASRAALTIGWERVWPNIAIALTIAGVFLAISFLGLWLEAPRWGRIAGVIVFGIAMAIALARLAGVRLPIRAERLNRLDRDSGLAHRPATTLDDSLANGGHDLATRAFWNLHRKRAEQAASALKLSPPSPRMVDRDRYAIRAGAGFIAGPEKYARVIAAFDWRTVGALSQGYRLDAWIDPPAYTGRPPIVLNLRDENGALAKGGTRAFSAPVGSTIIVRSSEGANVSAEGAGGLQPVKAEEAAKDGAPAPAVAKTSEKTTDQETRLSLRGDGHLIIKRFGSTVADFALTSIPDKPPVITLKGDPKPNLRGSLTLGYKLEDDYGIIGAEALFDKPIVAGKPVSGRSLVEAPKMPLALGSGAGGLGDGETTADLSEHAWAGARVTMTLSAKDEGGNEGRAEPVQVTLPQRVFTKPLAKALVEQRRNLVLAPDDRSRVATAIDALMIAPDKFGTSPAIWLGLRTISMRLAHARTDAALTDVADFMWEMALRIENGNLSDAERDLRSAEQQLRDAIQRGAPEQEIQKLMDQLRAALDKYLNEMARRDQNDPNAQQDAQRDPNAKSVTRQDLQSMLDRMQEMMKNGNMADAQKMLDQLQQMMENLQTARRPSRPDPMAREMNRALDELDQMTREEQELRDQTFRRDQDKQRKQRAQRDKQQGQRGDQQQSHRQRGQQQQGQRGQQGQQGQRGQQPGDDQADNGDDGDDDQQSADNGGEGDQQSLQQRQQDLRKRLDALKKRMQQFGMDGKQGLDEAGDAMADAEDQLGKGEQGRGKAVDAEGRAIEALRKGAQQLAQQMQQQGQQAGEQGGPGQPNGPMREGRDNANADPLGRDSHDKRDLNTQRYDPLGVPLAQRAQRVLEELRKRLGDPTRPREELDYLERLLKRY
jgi:uncharacterized protein (TIGR02302 family)